MKYLTAIILPFLMIGCSATTTTEVLEAIQLGKDECGFAELRGNLDVGGNPFASTTVVVNINKQKAFYEDSAGNVQPCP